MQLRQFVDWARESGTLIEIDAPVDPNLELARILHVLDGSPILFNRLKGYQSWRALSGLCAQRSHFAAALGCKVPDLISRMTQALDHPSPPQQIGPNAPCQSVVLPNIDLTQLPIPRYHALDGGPYITAGIVIVDDPGYGRNVAIHRLMRVDEKHLAIRAVERRGTHTAMNKNPTRLPVAIAIGCPIRSLLAAAMSPPKGVDEFGIANALAPLDLAQCQTVDLQVPAEAELVLEGHITGDQVREGGFPDLTGTMDITRNQRVIEIQNITRREAPIFHALLPGGLEHKNLMGMPREPTIFATVDRVCTCTGVYITPGGASWLHAVVQIDKRSEEDGPRAIRAAFEGHPSLKHVVIVDTDIDIYSAMDVEWAIATRFQADRNLIILTDQGGSSLDPSAMKPLGEKSLTAKMGIDATIAVDKDRAGFERLAYEEIDLHKFGL